MGRCAAGARARSRAHGHDLRPAGLPPLEVWPAVESTIPTSLLAQRVGPQLNAGEHCALLDARFHGPAPDDIVATWSTLNLGIDLGR